MASIVITGSISWMGKSNAKYKSIGCKNGGNFNNRDF